MSIARPRAQDAPRSCSFGHTAPPPTTTHRLRCLVSADAVSTDDGDIVTLHLLDLLSLCSCLSGDVPLAGITPRRIYDTSRSNDPIWALNQTLQTFAKLGIDKTKLVILLPWFGSDFICASATDCTQLIYSARDPAWFGGQCGQALDGGPGVGQALAIQQNRTPALGYSVSADLSWDEPSATNYFEWSATPLNSL